MTNHNTTDGELHYFANDGTEWRSTPSAVSTTEAREQDAAQDGTDGDGPGATNEVTLGQSVVEGSESQNNGGKVTEGESRKDESEDEEK